MIYLDNAATTKTSENIVKSMLPYFTEEYFNPASEYPSAISVKNDIEYARECIARFIGCDKSEIYFTSGGSESNNWALKGMVSKKKNHIITTKIEHHSILNTCKYLESIGCKVTYLDVDKAGYIDLKQLEKSITRRTALISIMMANNEIGVIQDVEAISRIAKKHNIPFHTDAVQALGHIYVDVNQMGIDMMSVSSHKFNGPKGVGFLYIKNGININPLIHGGSQENHMRAGTTNTAGIIGMSWALHSTMQTLKEDICTIKELRNYCFNELLKINGLHINGGIKNRVPNNINFYIEGLDSSSLLYFLGMNGICCSSGSACNSDLEEPSHVLKAIGLSDNNANSSIRITISRDTTREEINKTIDGIKLYMEGVGLI